MGLFVFLSSSLSFSLSLFLSFSLSFSLSLFHALTHIQGNVVPTVIHSNTQTKKTRTNKKTHYKSKTHTNKNTHTHTAPFFFPPIYDSYVATCILFYSYAELVLFVIYIYFKPRFLKNSVLEGCPDPILVT